ncbi:MAG: DUF1349 domain-containing protein [Opitutales bacterium]|nr:DUF1349 domain-containing protein [Opitutales bacterium]
MNTIRITLCLALSLCVPTASIFSAEADASFPASIVSSALPSALELVNVPTELSVKEDGSILMGASGHTNLFNSPNGVGVYTGAPMLLFPTSGDFTLSARIDAKLVNVYDVAALVMYVDGQNWTKLCYELSAEKCPTVVSVVTRGISDDCNSEEIDTDFVYMAMCRRGQECSFHFSRDGVKWKMVRHFRFESSRMPRIGFAVHAAYGEGLSASFSDIHYWTSAPANMRSLDLKLLSVE